MTDIVIDLDGVTDKAGLMDRFAEGLRLPDWFGRNWDALTDVLRDQEERRVVVRDWRPYAKARPDEWEIALEIFEEARVPVLLAL
ncbi:barstar family protein [Streptomyces niveiscabiei]|uniref:barstar family protein n=1 Tax=Streptomyces niveiscabiei TaxID=164115 RepID=UPI0029AF916A|nr:barstar family protein [Streptomyces niveiscabiei]MDX3381725.1 barstar family protein [Streptomyces niveiscabiei]